MAVSLSTLALCKVHMHCARHPSAAVNGLQGEGVQLPSSAWQYFPEEKVVALGKHYAAYGAASMNAL